METHNNGGINLDFAFHCFLSSHRIVIQHNSKFFGTVKIPFLLISKINKFSPLNQEVLIELGFNTDGDVWIHFQEHYFSIQLKQTSFYVAIWDTIVKQPFKPTVGMLEEQFQKKTGKSLYSKPNRRKKVLS